MKGFVSFSIFLILFFGGTFGVIQPSIAISSINSYTYSPSLYPGGSFSFAEMYDIQNDQYIIIVGSVSYIFERDLQSHTGFTNVRYHIHNSTLSFYDQIDSLSVDNFGFTNPITRDMYFIDSVFRVLKYNDTHLITGDFDLVDGTYVSWFNLTNYLTLDFERPSGTRFAYQIAYNYVDEYFMLFGGALGLADTWIFDLNDNEWKFMTPVIHPGFRIYYTLVYDPSINKMIFFGGIHFSYYFNDLWFYEYASNTWEEIETRNTPFIRAYHRMMWDPVNELILMYGGTFKLDQEDVSLHNEPDLWAFNSTNGIWTFLTAIGTGSIGSGHFMQINGNATFFHSNNVYQFELDLKITYPTETYKGPLETSTVVTTLTINQVNVETQTIINTEANSIVTETETVSSNNDSPVVVWMSIPLIGVLVFIRKKG